MEKPVKRLTVTGGSVKTSKNDKLLFVLQVTRLKEGTFMNCLDAEVELETGSYNLGDLNAEPHKAYTDRAFQ